MYETFLLPLSLKVLRIKERDRHSFYSGFSICTPQHVWRPLQGHCELAKVTLLLRTTRLNSWLFSKSPKSSARSFTSSGQIFSLRFLFWDLWTTHPPCARVNTCAQGCTKLTHVLSRKVLSLTKPKDKIYKTKSLGHYITLSRLFNANAILLEEQ